MQSPWAYIYFTDKYYPETNHHIPVQKSLHNQEDHWPQRAIESTRIEPGSRGGFLGGEFCSSQPWQLSE